MSILNGNYFGAKVLLNEIDLNVETEQTVMFEDSLVEGATALWLACAMGSMQLVKLLIKHGANINHSTYDESTPMRVSCYNNRVDIIRYLLSHGACVESPNIDSNTCLMIATFRGHFQVVNYALIKKYSFISRLRFNSFSLDENI